VIYEIDPDADPANWPKPSDTLRRAGVNQWYRLKGTNLYPAKIEGDLLGTVSDVLIPPAY
jgi:hypothetical protein